MLGASWPQKRTKGQSVLARFFLQITRYESPSLVESEWGCGRDQGYSCCRGEVTARCTKLKEEGTMRAWLSPEPRSPTDQCPRPVVVRCVRTRWELQQSTAVECTGSEATVPGKPYSVIHGTWEKQTSLCLSFLTYKRWIIKVLTLKTVVMIKSIDMLSV